MALVLETTLRDGTRAVFEVRSSLDGCTLERALLGLEFILACLPYQTRALRPAREDPNQISQSVKDRFSY